MPAVLDRDGYKFFFYSNEHMPEHVHVKRSSGKAKCDLSDGVQLLESKGMKIAELKRAQEIAEEEVETLKENGMNTLTDKAPSAFYADGRVRVTFADGTEFAFPIAGNWRLEDATAEQLNHMEVDEDGIHWPDVDEDLSFEGLLRGDHGQFVGRRPAICAVA